MVGSGRYRRDVQGLRGIAVLIVVLFHAGLGFPGGFVGVDVFFVISGFVIGRGLIAEAQASGRVSLAHFYGRRVRRLLPALAAMLSAVTLVVVVVMSPAFPQPNALMTARAANFSVSNLYLYAFGAGYFNPVDENNPFVHTWSLGVEEQFYLVFPLLVGTAWWLARRLRRVGPGVKVLTGFLLAAAAFSLVCSIAWTFDITPLAARVPQAARFAFYGPVSRIWEFIAGVLIALLAQKWAGPLSGITARGMRVMGLLLIAFASLTFSNTTPFPGVAAAIPVAGAALVIAAGDKAVAKFLEVEPLVWLGDRSYGWYLWHWPAIVLVPLIFPDLPAAAPLAALASLVPAMLSYRYLERRFQLRRGEPKGASTAPRLAAVSVGVPFLVIGLALLGSSRNWGLDDHPELATESLSQAAGCYKASTPLENCTYRSDGARGTIMVVGDSHADIISDVVVEAGRSMHYDVVVQSALGCPFISRPLPFDADCVARQQQILSAVAAVEPDLLVIANNTPDAIWTLGGRSAGDDLFRPSDMMLDKWERALRATLDDVTGFAGRTLLFSTVPVFTTTEFDRTLPTLLRPAGGYYDVPVKDVAAWRTRMQAAEQRAVDASAPETSVIDPMPVLCADGTCSLRQSNGLFRYRDPAHLSNPTALQLDGLLVPAIEHALAQPGRPTRRAG